MKRACLLSFVLLLFLPFHGTAQNSDWDKVLDRYQEICGQCITLRDRIVAGEPVSDKAVTSLLQELSQLRNTLQNASGSMSDEQKTRFNAIRDSYTGNTATESTKPVETQSTAIRQTKTDKPESASTQKQETIQSSRLDTLYNNITSITIARPQISNPSIKVTDPIKPIDIVVPEAQDNKIDIKRQYIFETYLLAAYNRTASLGGMFILGKEKAKCIYISILSNFSNTKSDYSCSSNGIIEGGGVFWGDGTVADNLLFVTAGTAVWNSYSGKTSVYAGIGYGINERLWRDITGKWAVVSDVSGSGLILQTAAAFRINRIAISPGLTYMPKSKYILPSLGIGYSF